MTSAIFRGVIQLRDWYFRRVMIRSVMLSGALAVGMGLAMGWLVMLLPDVAALPLIGAVDLPLVGTVTVPAVGEVAVPFRQVDAVTFPLVIMISSVLMFPIAGMTVNLMLDRIVETVEARDYPHLRELKHSTLAETIGGAVMFGLFVLTINTGALIFYMVAGALAPLVFWVVNGIAIGYEFFNLVAGRRLPPEEVADLRRRYGYRIGLVGCLIAIPLSLPLIGLFMPVLGAAVFTHLFHRMWRAEQKHAMGIGQYAGDAGAEIPGEYSNQRPKWQPGLPSWLKRLLPGPRQARA